MHPAASAGAHLERAPLRHVDGAGDVRAALVEEQLEPALEHEGGLGVGGAEVDPQHRHGRDHAPMIDRLRMTFRASSAAIR